MAALHQFRWFYKNNSGDALVEAAILFPIMIMIFAALVLLAVYLPTRAALQRATQYAATVLATERSDTWLFFDDGTMSFYWETEKDRLDNVYVALFSDGGDVDAEGRAIVTAIENRGISSKSGTLSVNCHIENRIVYKEVVATATREFTIPFNLSIINFPKTISVTATSIAVIQNGDEFIRNVDLAVDFVEYICKKFGVEDAGKAISGFREKAAAFLGW